MKQIEITVNDDTKQEDIDLSVRMIQILLDLLRITAVLIVTNSKESNEQT